MNRILSAVLASFALALTIGSAQAVNYNFNFTFDGANVSLDGGSDVPDGTSLMVGDSFVVDITSTPGSFWRVISDFSDFVPLSFSVSDAATRNADISTSWSKGGVEQFSLIESGINQGDVHVGAQTWLLDTGLEFDQVVLTWVFNSISDPVTSVMSALGIDIFEPFGDSEGPFFRASEIEFVSSVPLPAGLPLLGGALVLLGLVRRRRAT